MIINKNLRRYWSGLLFAVLITNFTTNLIAQTTLDSTFHLIEVIYKFERLVQDTINAWEVPGAAIAIVKNNNIVYVNGFGIRENGREERIDIHTIFRLGSVSKGFASVLAGLLVEEGKLNWDDKVVKFFPNFSLSDPRSTKNLTLRHILSHTSGLPQHTFTDLLEEDLPLPEIIDKLNTVPVIAPVGKVYSYQNVIYSLISDIVEIATGKTYKDLVKERLFDPLGMQDASLGREPFMASTNRALPHVRRDLEWKTVEVKNAYYNVLPSAGVNASILDMAQWLRAMMGGLPYIISPQVIQTITTPIVKTPREGRYFRWHYQMKDAHYGMGWRIFEYAGMKLLYHGGWVEGYRAEIGFIPERKIGIVILLNCDGVMANYFLPTFFEMYLNSTDIHSIQTSN